MAEENNNNGDQRVIQAKQALMEALGENSGKYLANMKMWFRQKWSKELFDLECRKLFTREQQHLHNQFLLAILNKIDTVLPPVAVPPLAISSNIRPTSSTRKRKRPRLTDHLTFDAAAAEPLDYLPEENLASRPTDNGQPMQERYCVQELFLPDNGLVLGRLLIGAWEVGLSNVDEACAEMIGQAVQVLLKNILTAILMKRKGYKTTGSGTFAYDFGAPIKDIFTRNTVTRSKIDDSPIELDKEITSMNMPRRVSDATVVLASCEEPYHRPHKRISTLDLYLTLHDRSVIPSHSIHSINMERISNLLDNSL